MSEVNFPEGIFADRPHENAPDFIKAKISVKVDKAVPWLQGNANHNGYVDLDLKVSKGGKLYLSLNDFKPQGAPAPQQPAPQDPPLDDDIPF